MVIKGYIFRKSRLNIVCFGNELSANLRSERFTYKWPEINTTYYWASENLHNTIITGKFKEYHNIEVIRIIEKSTLDVIMIAQDAMISLDSFNFGHTYYIKKKIIRNWTDKKINK